VTDSCEECLRLRADHYRHWNEFLALMNSFDTQGSGTDAELWLAESEASSLRCDASLRVWQKHQQLHHGTKDLSYAA
jgi:hypothetical protein